MRTKLFSTHIIRYYEECEVKTQQGHGGEAMTHPRATSPLVSLWCGWLLLARLWLAARARHSRCAPSWRGPRTAVHSD